MYMEIQSVEDLFFPPIGHRLVVMVLLLLPAKPPISSSLTFLIIFIFRGFHLDVIAVAVAVAVATTETDVSYDGLP